MASFFPHIYIKIFLCLEERKKKLKWEATLRLSTEVVCVWCIEVDQELMFYFPLKILLTYIDVVSSGIVEKTTVLGKNHNPLESKPTKLSQSRLPWVGIVTTGSLWEPLWAQSLDHLGHRNHSKQVTFYSMMQWWWILASSTV